MGAPVYLQLSGRNESLATVGAQVRFLSCVNPYVYVQVSRHGETLPAVGALKGPLACMTAHVKVQLVLELEGFAAACANLRSLLGVAQLVSSQTRSRAEKLPALLAPIGQQRRMGLLM